VGVIRLRAEFVPSWRAYPYVALVGASFSRVPRPLRSFEPGGFYHLTARGNNRGAVVIDDDDRASFMRLLARTELRFGIRVHAWCLMTNHYHLVVEATTGDAACAYVLLNPVRAGLTGRPEDWRWAGAVGSAA